MLNFRVESSWYSSIIIWGKRYISLVFSKDSSSLIPEKLHQGCTNEKNTRPKTISFKATLNVIRFFKNRKQADTRRISAENTNTVWINDPRIVTMDITVSWVTWLLFDPINTPFS